MRTIAFIPVRGGSKSIPLKNIKPFCGKPLVCWNIEALEACDQVDEIIVATDSKEIEQVVLAGNYTKTHIYHRSAENACDTASTESVMLEYIEKYIGTKDDVRLADDDVFMLVQATSPLTQTYHFSEALQQYAKGEYDSMLTCVRNKRFFWKADGSSLNYDYRHRPRRQEFDGLLMENGAFYINTVANILASGNRLSGKIGIYEMPEYTSFEIDEPDDWIIMENLMRKHVLNQHSIDTKKIKLFLCDVDGTLTDGGMYYSENGDELKKFNTRDGVALSMLREKGIKTGIITSEDTQIVSRRAAKLKVDYLIQGKRDGGKLAAAQEICNEMGITLQEAAYVGDDLNCVELLSAVGFAACPADACEQVKQIPDIHILSKKGGDGVVREVVEKYFV
ncbi:MAG: acylneuraminate cytidylyltransferase [Paludibacteraceae bacterium]|nr:acylneuraminate cytidylyltransferase [Paludibacteraceae bacterium]